MNNDQPTPASAASSATPDSSTPTGLDRVRADLAARAPDLVIEIADSSSATVTLAAKAFGVTPGRIAKSLALQVGERAVLVVASGDRRLDNRKIRQTFHAKGRMLNAEQTLAVTGHAVGGVCPFGLTTDLPIYCDISLRGYDEVVPAAGSTHSAVRIAPDRLAALTGNQWVDVCQDAVDEREASDPQTPPFREVP